MQVRDVYFDKMGKRTGGPSIYLPLHPAKPLVYWHVWFPGYRLINVRHRAGSDLDKIQSFGGARLERSEILAIIQA